MKKICLFLIFFSICFGANPRVLHLSFHQGCLAEFEGVAKELSLDVTSWFIQSLPPYFFDPVISGGNALYNVGHDRAQRVWEKHKDFFNSFDAIITSDTAPLSRIFLQNGFQKPLIIWVCNRFDYCDWESLDCAFPDQEYYDLFRQAKRIPNVTLIGYTPFENYYAASKGVDIGNLVIKPCTPILEKRKGSIIPLEIDKSQTFLLPPRHNETIFMNFSDHLHRFGVQNYCGSYNGPGDIADFKGVIHLPYAWSNLALFENLQLGLPYFVPSERFLKELMNAGNYWFQDRWYLVNNDLFALSEWYCPEIRDVLVYFDSWEDLAYKTKTIDYAGVKARTKAFAEKHKVAMLARWREVFDTALVSF